MMSTAQPLVISIGPALSGKTTYLNSLKKPRGTKIEVCAIDDMDGVYINVPMPHARRLITGSTSIISRERFNDRRAHGILHSERILEDQGEEARVILQLLTRDLEFGDAISSKLLSIWMKSNMRARGGKDEGENERKATKSGNKKRGKGKDDKQNEIMEAEFTERNQLILETIREELESGLRMQSRYYQMFCSHSIRYAIVECKKSLLQCARSERGNIVCFGNTNTNIEHYAYALEVAAKTQRPVQFARFKSELGNHDLVALYRRNLKRFAETGKYIPLHAIVRQMVETEEILVDKGRLRKPKELCDLAGFAMLEGSLVEPKRKPPSPKATADDEKKGEKKNEPSEKEPSAWKQVEEQPTASLFEPVLGYDGFPVTEIGYDGFPVDPHRYIPAEEPATGPMGMPNFSYADASAGVTLAYKEMAMREELEDVDDFDHFDHPPIADSINIPPSDENMAALMEMGFEAVAALEALKNYGDNIDEAMNALLGGA